MAINFLDEVYTQLEQLDLVGSRKEFCEQWLARAEGYVRTLRFYRYQPSVDVLSVLANRLDHYARHFAQSDVVVQKSLETLSTQCWADIQQRSRLAWMRAEASRSRERRHGHDVEAEHKESVNG
jgi:hypothetical protein